MISVVYEVKVVLRYSTSLSPPLSSSSLFQRLPNNPLCPLVLSHFTRLSSQSGGIPAIHVVAGESNRAVGVDIASSIVTVGGEYVLRGYVIKHSVDGTFYTDRCYDSYLYGTTSPPPPAPIQMMD